MVERPTVVVVLAADARHARDLAAGGVFVPGCTLALTSECVLVVRGAAGELCLEARVVFLDPQQGAGLELVGFCAEMKEQLARIAAVAPAEPAEGMAEGEVDADADADVAVIHDAPIEAGPDDPAAPTDPSDDADADSSSEGRTGPLTVHERLRNLTLPQQLKKAHSTELNERILLERMYGKAVWEALLRNPRLTPPEVSRIARMGMLPRPLIEIIVNNGAWLQIPEVRRALLANPRLQTDQVLRVLRILPKHELKLAALQTSYPYAVRDAAKRMLKEMQ